MLDLHSKRFGRLAEILKAPIFYDLQTLADFYFLQKLQNTSLYSKCKNETESANKRTRFSIPRISVRDNSENFVKLCIDDSKQLGEELAEMPEILLWAMRLSMVRL